MAKRRARRRTRSAAAQIAAWQDDPLSRLPAIPEPVPQLAKPPLKLEILGAAVPPGTYDSESAEFRYWNAASALRRGCDFWAPLLAVKRWQPGSVLPIGLDEGVDLNAYYDRSKLAFFHDSAGGETVFSCASPDVVCHELGHACLDAHRPELWDAPYVEVASFHESFGDMSAILSALQLPSVRAVSLAGLARRKASKLSRLAEQLGWALRQIDPRLVNPDCLRNAWNAFEYVHPESLPDNAPASQLCAEPHSFSRVFTGAFYDILGGMLRARARSPRDADVVAVAADAGRLLVDATHAAPVEPDYYAQVAAHMIDADAARFGGKYRKALADAFVKRKILPAQAVAGGAAPGRKLSRAAAAAAAAHGERPARPRMLAVRVDGAALGLPHAEITARAPLEEKSFAMVSAAIASGARALEPRATAAAHRFVRMLAARRRIDVAPAGGAATRAAERPSRHTHALVATPQGVQLVRRGFD